MVSALSLSFVSCDSEKEKEDLKPTQTRTVEIDASSFTDYTYFSFEKGTVVTVKPGEEKNSLNWDLGFRRQYVRTNSGASGKGQGGAILTEAHGFGQIKNFTGEFVTDVVVKLPRLKEDLSGFIMPAILDVLEGGNVELNKWAQFQVSKRKFQFNNNVYIVRTAKGDMAKVIFHTFYKDIDGKQKTGYIKMTYEYPFYNK